MKMKKIAVMGASMALAALPIAGTFASVEDTVVITIAQSCTLEAATGSQTTRTVAMTNGQLKSDIGGVTMDVNCNDVGGWYVTAVGSGDDASVKTAMNASNGATTDIATGTATTGDTSNWAFKVSGTGTTGAGYTSFSPIPGTAQHVADGTGTVSEGTITATYQVFISPTQEAGTYTGKVTYTVMHPASS